MSSSTKTVAPYGTWASSLTAANVTSSSASSGIPYEYQNCVLATESRPAEAGRVALVGRHANGEAFECLPTDFSIRTRVHEYGGRAWWTGDQRLYFCNWSDQRVYVMKDKVTNLIHPTPITPEPLAEHTLRFADGVETPDGAWVIAVAEIHGEDRVRFDLQGSVQSSIATEPANVVVAIPTDGTAAKNPLAIKVLATGADFMSNPRVSVDGRWVSWLQWHHPNMPWDSTELMVAALSSDSINITADDAIRYSGGDGVAIVGPEWVQGGRLIYSSDVNGWWNLHMLTIATKKIETITDLDSAEIGAPPWGIGTTRFCELKASVTGAEAGIENPPWLAAVVTENAVDWLAVIHQNGTLKRSQFDCAAIRGLTPTADGGLVALADFKDAESLQVRFSTDELNHQHKGTPFNANDSNTANAARLFEVSAGEAVCYPSASSYANAFFYAPMSNDYRAENDELPPLIVMSHGGPTTHATASIKLAIQYWTSRGFAVVDVNYRGSSGFGREYRQGLNEAWGVVDVEDCVNVVDYLVNTGRVDPKRCVIRGGSAGGLTVLRALQVSDVFAAGVSLYGVADLEGLLSDTHKFESRYLDNLVGKYPEQSARYKERSPIHHAHNINVPLLVLQGDEDKVVPPSQSEAIVAAVAKQELPHAYVVFEGEQHGWRKAATMIRALELELWFYGATLDFTPTDEIEPPRAGEAVGFL